MARLSLVLPWALQLLAVSAAPMALKGQEVHCIREVAHLVVYDIAGEPNYGAMGAGMQGIERAVISVEPSPAHASHCSSGLGAAPNASKAFCYGANVDLTTCDKAEKVLPLPNDLQCKECFMSASANAYYKLDYSELRLNSLEVGFKDLQMRASVSVDKKVDLGKHSFNGILALPGTESKLPLIDTVVGCPLCVPVKVSASMPTKVTYSLELTGNVEVELGAALDVKFGDNLVRYDHAAGWNYTTQNATAVGTPILSIHDEAKAELTLGLETGLRLDLDGILWYHLHLDPTLPLTLQLKGEEVCLDGGATFTMSQEADLDWHPSFWSAKDHWGPKVLWSWSKPGVIHKCQSLHGSGSAAIVI